MEAFIAVLVMGGVIAFAIISDRSARARRRSVLEQLAAVLGGTAHPDTASLTAKRYGLPISYKFADRGSGSSHEPWTDVVVSITSKYPLTMRIERARHVRSAHVIDIEIGHPEFDRDFVIEAAPADVVRQLLDVRARAFLDGLSKVELFTGPGTLTLSIPGWQEDASEVVNLVDNVARIGSRIRDAYAAADAAVEVQDVGSPYRSEIDQAPALRTEQVRRAQLAEVAAIQSYRAEQARATGRMLSMLVFGIMGFLVLCVGMSLC